LEAGETIEISSEAVSRNQLIAFLEEAKTRMTLTPYKALS
jgi:hypothetical protein